jgi:hypothetical protein
MRRRFSENRDHWRTEVIPKEEMSDLTKISPSLIQAPMLSCHVLWKGVKRKKTEEVIGDVSETERKRVKAKRLLGLG